MNAIATPLLLLGGFSLTLACASPGPERWAGVPMVIQERFEVTQTAQLGPTGFDAESFVPPPGEYEDLIGDPEAIIAEYEAERFVGPGSPYVSALLVTFELSETLADQILAPRRATSDAETGDESPRGLFGEAGLLEAKSATQCLKALVDAGRVRVLKATRFRGKSGQSVRHSLLKKTAYVERFDCQQEGLTMVADPIVSVVWSGFVCDLRFHSEGDAGRPFQLDVEKVSLVSPMPYVATDVAEAMPGLPVTIQIPIFRRSDLEVGSNLGRGQMLYLLTGGYEDRPGQKRKVLLTLILTMSDNWFPRQATGSR